MLIAAATLLGCMESYKLHLRVEALERFLTLITVIETEMRYYALPLRQIVTRHSDAFAFLCHCQVQLEAGKSFAQAWQAGIAASAKGKGLKQKDKALMEQFGTGLGDSDIEGQLAHCRTTQALLTVQIEQARAEKTKKSKLFSVLGLCGGAGVALLIC